MLELFTEDGELKGISHGEKEKLVLKDLQQQADRLQWYQSITKPLRMELVFDVVVNGDDMTGTAKGGPMPGGEGQRPPGAEPPTRLEVVTKRCPPQCGGHRLFTYLSTMDTD